MKKLLVGAFLGMFAVAGVAVLPNLVNAQGANDSTWATPGHDTNMIGDGNQKLTGSTFLDTLKNAINWLLGILATVALVMCLYGGFKMVTAAGDEKKYGDGLKVLKYAAIGLGVIGLSWMIVSVVFWFVGTLSGGNQTTSSQSSTQVTDNVGSPNAGQTDETNPE